MVEVLDCSLLDLPCHLDELLLWQNLLRMCIRWLKFFILTYVAYTFTL
jgi:hypothetical protein